MNQPMYMTGATAAEIEPLVMAHHYSKRMPGAIQHAFAWRDAGGLFGDYGEPMAGILYGQPNNAAWPDDVLELQRLVRMPHVTLPLSSFVAWSLRWLKKHAQIAFLISYADTDQNHHGGIYQATNWRYVACRENRFIGYRDPEGNFYHPRSVVARYGTQAKAFLDVKHPDWVRVEGGPKHLYVYPMRMKMKEILANWEWSLLPYPKPDPEKSWKSEVVA